MNQVKSLYESPQLRPFDSRTMFETGHKDAVNDARLDFYSKKLATASTDKTVRIYSVDNSSGAYHRLAELTGYDGPVWQVSWSHPKIGSLLATASYDGRIIIWKEADDEDCPLKSKWYSVFDEEVHKVSVPSIHSQFLTIVNSVAWAPPDEGILLAAGSSDGSISILSAASEEDNRWTIKRILKAHELGCQSLSWSHSTKRFASGGNDYTVKIWSQPEEKQWTLESTLQGHSDWVFSVEWSPIPGQDLICSAGRDGRILLWSKVVETEKPKWNHSSSFSNSNTSLNNLSHSVISITSASEEWTSQVLQVIDKPSNSLNISWEPMGTFLCVAAGDDEVFIWKKSEEDKQWVCISKPKKLEEGKTIETPKKRTVSFVDVQLNE